MTSLLSGLGAQVLVGPRDLLAQRSSGVQWEIRVAQQFARQENSIGVAVAHDSVRLLGRRDHADRAGHDAGFAADSFREWYLVAGTDSDLGARHNAAAGAVQQIHRLRFQQTS